MRSFPFAILVVAVLAGCNQGNPAPQTENRDSLEQLGLLKAVYQWHDKNQNRIDFLVIVKNSFQTGLNYDSFNLILL